MADTHHSHLEEPRGWLMKLRCPTWLSLSENSQGGEPVAAPL
jgi:hypothetical protein